MQAATMNQSMKSLCLADDWKFLYESNSRRYFCFPCELDVKIFVKTDQTARIQLNAKLHCQMIDVICQKDLLSKHFFSKVFSLNIQYLLFYIHLWLSRFLFPLVTNFSDMINSSFLLQSLHLHLLLNWDWGSVFYILLITTEVYNKVDNLKL